MRKNGVMIMIAAVVVLSCIWYTDAKSLDTKSDADISEEASNIEDEPVVEVFSIKSAERKTESVAGISFDIPAEWRQQNKSDSKFADVYYYPDPIEGTYAHYFDMFYVSLENISQTDAAETMIGYYSGIEKQEGQTASESVVQEISGERALRFAVHYDDKNKTEYTAMIPVHGEGLMVVTYAVKDGFDAIYTEEFEAILQSIEIPNAELVNQAYKAEIDHGENEDS